MTTRTIPRPFEIAGRRTATGFWLWPNLLSLQAPLVAILWQLLLARCVHVHVNPFEPLALGMSVWLIYVADHLIDTARPPDTATWEPPRKEFCRLHWRGFLPTTILVAVVLVMLASRFLSTTTVRGGWDLSLAVAGYFALIHLAPKNWRRDWPREFAVAAIFTIGTFGAVALALAPRLMPILPPAVLFAFLCWTNCSLIETWEWQAAGSPEDGSPNRGTRWVADHLFVLGILIACASALLAFCSLQPPAFAFAVSLSGAALAFLSHYRRALPLRFVSPAADLALCSPLLVLAFLRLLEIQLQ